MFVRLNPAVTLAAVVAVLLGGASVRPAAAAAADRCTYVAANQPQGAIATAWHRLGGQNGPLGCPSAPATNGSQPFQHGTISQPKANPGTTLATYLRAGRIHVSVTSLGRAYDRFQIASERSDGAPGTLWSFAGGSSAAFVAALPAGMQSPFRVKLYACETHESVFTAAALVCDRSEAATATSAPLELTMDPVSPHSAPTGTVALRPSTSRLWRSAQGDR